MLKIQVRIPALTVLFFTIPRREISVFHDSKKRKREQFGWLEENPKEKMYTPAAAALSRSIPPQCCKFQPIKKCTTRTCNWRSEPSPKEIRRKSGITKVSLELPRFRGKIAQCYGVVANLNAKLPGFKPQMERR